ncbi:hypothetical protein LHP98_18485 [Rhodobacter sp. Har01]|uniref:hypothetical protein n=1 Tax=Rhodobacter sp. Har01 TaxID=2883999 RepID=UPI001D05E8CF|nr:hypothetical protein [Rhodobacter sp. Har01]MCB6180110.1 hypothetical protein [Rhodobacter sp. Har01]
MLIRLGVEQRFEYGDNLGLDIPEEGTTALASTALSFALISETRTQSFILESGADLRFEDGPAGSDIGIMDPRVNLRYRRDAANSSLSLSGYYRESEVDYLRPLEDFVNEDGVIELPEDLADLNGSGTRIGFGASAGLELGTSAPLGLQLRAGFSGLDYRDVTDLDLVPIRRSNAGATVRLRFSPVSEGRIALDRKLYDAEDPEQTYRETTSVSAGYSHELSSRAVLDLSLGYSVIDSEEFGVTTREEGADAGLSLDYAMPNGSASAEFTASTTQDGTRLELTFGRSLDLPTGALSARLGLTQPEGGDVELIGGLSWRRDLPTGRLTASVERAVKATNQDEQRLTTFVSLGYDHDINAVSGIGLDMSYALIEESGVPGSDDRASLTARYSRDLTPDWAMNLGLAYQMREETGERSDSLSVFLTLGRSFDFRP